jgi:2-aminoethylphosphonate-pyruvate transaminase
MNFSKDGFGIIYTKPIYTGDCMTNSPNYTTKNGIRTTHIPDNDYILLTPGPLSTSKGVRAAMLKDMCTWDDEYKSLIEETRQMLLDVLVPNHNGLYTTVIMQGSGSFGVEAVLGSVIPKTNSGLLVLSSGVYGDRMFQMAQVLGIQSQVYAVGETEIHSLEKLDAILTENPGITHVGFIHCETTTGLLHNIDAIMGVIHKHKKISIADAMSSLGGIPIDIAGLQIDYIVSSFNKCVQGVPGASFIIAKITSLQTCKGNARSMSLDVYDQWNAMNITPGKIRYTSPTHTVRAFHQALVELVEEGGVNARYARYKKNHEVLMRGMTKLGFKTLVQPEFLSPIITSFYAPTEPGYSFDEFYNRLKKEGFVIYPGKVTHTDAFRIGNIGHIFPEDMERLIAVIEKNLYWKTNA